VCGQSLQLELPHGKTLQFPIAWLAASVRSAQPSTVVVIISSQNQDEPSSRR
jgi:hypothetical protein